MNKRLEMMKKDPYLCNTILKLTDNNVDKAYDIFLIVSKQDSWRISDIEKLI